jgi:integrase/recombinase XerD
MSKQLAESLETHLQSCLDWLHVRDYSPRTIDTYRLALQSFIDWVEGEKQLKEISDLTSQALQEYLVFLSLRASKNTRRGRKKKLLTASTKQGHIAALHQLFGYLTQGGYILTNPAHELERPRNRRRLPRTILTVEEIMKLLAYFQDEEPVTLRDRAILELLYSTAIRRSELERLTLNSLLLDENLLRVHGKGDKERLVPIGEEAARALQAYLERGRPKLCAAGSSALFLSRLKGRLRASAFLRTLKIVAKKVGIKKHVDIHCIRHTCATHMLQNGADIRYIKELLGHELLNTTQVYTRVESADLRKVLMECHPREKF